MKYLSTRGGESVNSATAIKQGLAHDGGLFLPDEIPEIDNDFISSLYNKTYAERAAEVMYLFLKDCYTKEELLEDCEKAYSKDKFVGGNAPVKSLDDGIDVLELWHGPTAAFKDMALQIMPRLLCRALEKTGEKRTALILVATSGDTGKAALEGYRDVDGIEISVFYPAHGVSTVQKLQMATQKGNNVNVCAIEGNFDDAQNGVKEIFGNEDYAKELDKKGCFLSSANSINWGRLVPQTVYYISAYADLCKEGKTALGEKIDVCVPTGNFGNIFAAYLAKQMGLPIEKLVCASNSNNVLTDFLATGTYDRNRAFKTTMSPSMDILISSNLERLLRFLSSADETAEYMSELKKNGKYTVSKALFDKISADFIGGYCSEQDTSKTIKEVFDKEGYLIDTHTAVAMYCARANKSSERRMLVASTASPYKFAADVLFSLNGERAKEELDSIDMLSAYSKTEITPPLRGIREREIRFNPENSIAKTKMWEEIIRKR